MSFVERQIDFGGKSKVLKDIKELKDEILSKANEIEQLRVRVEKLEKKYGISKVETKKIENKKGEPLGDENVAMKIMLIDNEDGDDLWNLLLIFDENNGKMFKMTSEQLESFCMKIVGGEMGEHVDFTDYEEEGFMCERDEDGDWVMKSD